MVDAGRIAHDGLTPAEHAASGSDDLQLMAERCQVLPDVLGHKRLDVHVASLEGSFREPSSLEGLLDVETEVGDIRHKLRVRLRLIEAAHDAESNADTILFHERGNDRMQRTLSRRECVRVISL